MVVVCRCNQLACQKYGCQRITGPLLAEAKTTGPGDRVFSPVVQTREPELTWDGLRWAA